MIKTFKGKLAKAIWGGDTAKNFPPDLIRPTQRKLVMIDSAADLMDLRSPPGNRLEALKGNRKGQYSIRINTQWRICFVWQDGHATQVEIVDYH